MISTALAMSCLSLLSSCNNPGGSRENAAKSGNAVNASGVSGSISQVYDRVSPAVVSINAARVSENPSPIADYILGRPGAARPVLQSMSAGSGFFISSDGHILTNNHVLGEANRVAVTLLDGRELPARIVGRDPETDLALLKVSGSQFPYVRFSAGANPKVGQSVIAIGNPFGLGTTATHGIVSAYGRNIGSPYVDYVQLDAPINQGNSGGPTFNERGEVIGVNTAIFSPSGGSVGIGFAIPAVTADTVSRQLMESGRVERGYVGASLMDLPRDLSTGAQPSGAAVAAVVIGGPAHNGGLRPGDLIATIAGKEVTRASDVIRMVASSKPGDTLRVTVRRAGRDVTMTLRIEKRPTR